MLKVTTHSQRSDAILELEGRLTGPWVVELRDCWLRTRTDAGRIRVVLKQVAFVDEAGKQLLIEMCRSGAEITGEGCMTKAIIEEIKERERS